MDQQEQRIDRVIREYDAQGWHRTGTDADRVCAEWLAEQVRDGGATAALEPFALSRVDPLESFIERDGIRISSVPFYDGAFTHDRGVEGRLGGLGSDAEIGLGEHVPNAPDTAPVNQARRRGSHRAIVAITRGHAPGLALTNAHAFLTPYGPPVLQVSSEQGALLTDHASRHARARIIVRAERTAAEAYNVVATVPGRNRTLAPLVVSTPRSGWWYCAGERGGGIACWLEVLRSIAVSGPARDVLFVAMSGHELGTLGITTLLERQPELVDRTHLWLHFGANIGAATEPTLRFSAPDAAIEALILDALARAGVSDAQTARRGVTLGAESGVVAERGVRTIGVVGGNALFHLEADRWSEAVDIPAVARLARAFTKVAGAIAAA